MVTVAGPQCVVAGTYRLVWDSARPGPHAELEVSVVAGRGQAEFIIPADASPGDHLLSLSSQPVRCDDVTKCGGPPGVLFEVGS